MHVHNLKVLQRRNDCVVYHIETRSYTCERGASFQALEPASSAKKSRNIPLEKVATC